MIQKKFSFEEDISIVLAGAAGQGIQTVEKILVAILKEANYYVYATKEYMSRVRGGVNSIEIRVGSKPVRAFLERIDIFVPLNKGAMERIFLKRRLTSDTIVVGEKEILEESIKEYSFIDIPFVQMAKDLGNKIYSNVIAVGVLSALLQINIEEVIVHIEKYFFEKSKNIVENNIKAAKKGYKTAQEILVEKQIKVKLQADDTINNDILINGTEAISLGALAGGCNFISSYPMSPSTGVLIFLAEKAKEFGIVMTQAEDEISAINQTIGAWYAGGRGIVTTSGGGFALMNEGVSLAGVTETPFVLHLAQRVGPGTGLPTRTEQGDLNLALYAGHGDFGRFLFAPGTLEEGFQLAQRAFNLADKYQIPVIILTDQYFVDTYYNIKELNIDEYKNKQYITKTDKNYKRYQFTNNGISPRGIPSYGNGFVAVDSDEHNEEGRITENHDIREKMAEKRYFKKLKAMKADFVEPVLVGKEKYKTLLVGWGSTFCIIEEALKQLENEKISFLHFSQVYPLHPKIEEYLKKAENVIFIENNLVGQFANLIQLKTRVNIQHRILKSNGLPFSVEELVEEIKKLVKEFR